MYVIIMKVKCNTKRGGSCDLNCYFPTKITGGQHFSSDNCLNTSTVKPVLSGHSERRPKMVFKADYRLMKVKSIAEHSAILSTSIKFPFVINIFVCLFLSGRLRQVLLYMILL